MTAQVSETIIIEEKKLALLTEPLAPLLEEKEVEFTARSSACWRGYIGTWELKNDGLYLIAFDGIFNHEKVELKDLYKKESSDPVKANWFSGELRIPIGEMVIYVHGGYESSYSEELIITIDRGDAINFIHEVFHFKEVKVLTSTMFADEPTYGYGCKVDSKDSIQISKDEMIDIINEKTKLPKHGIGGSYNF